jgi:hypothetical protein
MTGNNDGDTPGRARPTWRKAGTVPQDPAIIQAQIENTRAELAETVDAIAEIVSPKRVTRRAVAQVRERIDLVKERVRPSDRAAGEIGPGLGQAALPAGGAAAHAGLTSPGGAQPRKVVRWDRVAVTGGLIILLVVMTIRRRGDPD